MAQMITADWDYIYVASLVVHHLFNIEVIYIFHQAVKNVQAG